MHLSDIEKIIYNEYLRAKRKGKPFNARKNFDDIDDATYISLKRLGTFFTSFPNIRYKDFFDAGILTPQRSERPPELAFFTSMRAIKMYNEYIKEKLNSADDGWVLSFCKESLFFIYEFCKSRGISVADYLNIKTPAGFPWFIIHLKDFKICIYAILAFEGIDSKLVEYSDEVRQIISDDFLKCIPQHRTNFFASKKCKALVREGLKLINT